MMLFLSCGRFDVITLDGLLNIETPVQDHIHNFINHYMSEHPIINEISGVYRIQIPHDVFVNAISAVIDDIDYTAFKA